MRRLLILFALLGVAAPAAAAEFAATPATFWTIIARTAQPGDIVRLAAGAYPDPKFFRVSRPGGRVLVKPQKPDTVTFAALSVASSEGLAFQGLEVLGPVNINGSSRIEISGSRIRSEGESRPTGVTVRNSSDIVVRGNDISAMAVGVAVYANPVGGIVVEKNTIHDIVGPDGIDSFSSVNVTIAHNVIRDIAPSAGAHPDAIQVDSPVPGMPRSKGVKVLNNRYERGTGKGSAAAQGVFTAHVDDLTIRGNELFGTMFNGISVSDVAGGLVEDNFVQGLPDYPSHIITRGGSTDVTVRGNTASDVKTYAAAGEKPLERYVADGNTKVPSAKNAGDTGRRGAWRSLMEAKEAGVAPPSPPADGKKKPKRDRGG